MPECPVCWGDGGHDLRDSNALLKEQLTDRELAFIGGLDCEWAECDECEGTGVVSKPRLAELMAAARAQVDQALAAFTEKGILK